MELPFLVFWLLLIHSITEVTAIENDVLICDQTYYLEVGTQGVVSCEYDQSFFAVRWYFDGAEISFLRLDGTSKTGSGIDNGEFDIEDDGSMVINEVRLNHEGRYTISVLHSSGIVSSEDIMVYAVVLLNTVVVTNCQSSPNVLCTHVPFEQRERTLLCVAENARPAVELSWKTTLHGENFMDPPKNYVNTDTESLLYTSYSILSYKNKLFSLEYFTCEVTGTAAKNVHNASVLVEGITEVSQPTGNVQYVPKGSSFQFRCPKNSLQSAVLKVTYSSGIEKTLMAFHSGDVSRQCLDSSVCQVTENGLITFEDVLIEDEGSYECVFGDGVNFYTHVINLTVVVSPSPPMTVIDGCEDTQKCQLMGPALGTLKCSLFGSRPPTNLSYVAETSDIFIFNIRNQIVNAKESGNFDTILTAEYEIKKCGSPVLVTCRAESKIHNNIKFSEMGLLSDRKNCKDKSNTGIVVFLVLLIVVFLIGAITTFIFIKKKRDSSQDTSKTSGKHQEGDEEGVKFLPNEGIDKKEENESEEPLLLAGKNKKDDSTKKDKLQDTGTIENEIEEGKESEVARDLQETENSKPQENYDKHSDEMRKSQEKEAVTSQEKMKKVKDPKVGSNLQETETSKSKNNDDKHSYKKEKLQEIETVTRQETRRERLAEKEGELEEAESERNQTTGGMAYETKRKPSTGEVINNRTEDSFELTYMELTERHKDKKNCKSEIAHDVIKHYLENKITLNTVFTYVCFSGMLDEGVKKIAFVYFLQSSIHVYQGVEMDPRCHHLFNEILTEALQNQVPVDKKRPEEKGARIFKEKILEELKSHPTDANGKRTKKENISKILVKVLVYCVKKTMINNETFAQMLEEELKYGTLSSDQLTNTLVECLTKKLIATKSLVSVLHSLVETKQLSADQLTNTLVECLTKKLIATKSLVSVLHSLVETKQMPSDAFTDLLQQILQTNKKDKFTDILHKNVENGQIEKETYVTALQSLLAKKEIEQKAYVRALQSLLSKKEINLPSLIELLKRSVHDTLIEKETYVTALQSLLSKKEINCESFTDILKSSLNDKSIEKETYITALQSLLEKKEINCRSLIDVLTGSLHDKLIEQETYVTTLQSLLEKKEINLESFTDMLKSSLNDKSIEKETYITALQSLLEKKEINFVSFSDELKSSLRDKLIEKETYITALQSLLEKKEINFPSLIDALKGCLHDRLIEQETYVTTLQSLLEKKEINLPSFFDMLKSSLHDKLVDVHLFEEKFKHHLQKRKWNKEGWVRLVSWLSEKQCITDDLRLTLLHLVIEEYKISEKQMKKILQSLKMDSEKTKNFMSGVKFDTT